MKNFSTSHTPHAEIGLPEVIFLDTGFFVFTPLIPEDLVDQDHVLYSGPGPSVARMSFIQLQPSDPELKYLQKTRL